MKKNNITMPQGNGTKPAPRLPAAVPQSGIRTESIARETKNVTDDRKVLIDLVTRIAKFEVAILRKLEASARENHK